RVRLITQTRTSGGSSDTDVKALAVIPYMSASPCVVTTVTPVAKAPSARRDSSPLDSRCPAVVGSGTALSVAAMCPSAAGAGADLLEPPLDHLVEVLCRSHRLREQPLEVVPLHREQRRRCHGLHRRHPRRAAQDRDLAEELPTRQRREGARLPV